MPNPYFFPISLGVDSFTTESVKIDTLSGIRPLKGLEEFPGNASSGGYSLVVVLVLVGLSWFLYQKYFRKKVTLSSNIPTSGDPYAWAEKQIRTVVDNKTINMAPYQHYFTKISEIMREFIYHISQIDALRFTTSQIVEELKNQPLWDPKKQEMAKNLLQMADQVKFSGICPDSNTVNQFTRLALDLVGRSKPHS